MKKLFLAASLAACAAAPAFAQQSPYPLHDPYIVVYDNQIVGRDPDPNVRLDLLRNGGCYLRGCGE